MTGERVLYIVLIAVAIGIGIYGSMNNLFRPHVYYVCEGDRGVQKTFYVNERERNLTQSIDGLTYTLSQYGDETKGVIQYTLFNDYTPLYPENWKTYFNKLDTNFVTEMWLKGYVAGTWRYTNCTITRQFLQRN